MILDLIQPSNLNMYNISLAHTIGLYSAVYCNEILNILDKVTKKNKFDEDGYFKIDRNYVFKRTTLSIENQLNIDNSLSKINLISKKDRDIIKIDVQLLCDIMANDNISVNDDIRIRTTLKNSNEAKESKKETIRKRLKNNISCDDVELKHALFNWIDSMYEAGKSLNKTTVINFQDVLFKYTGGSVDLALTLVKIATVNCYRECQWAINIYERDNKNRNKMVNNNKVITRVSEENLSDGELTEVYY